MYQEFAKRTYILCSKPGKLRGPYDTLKITYGQGNRAQKVYTWILASDEGKK